MPRKINQKKSLAIYSMLGLVTVFTFVCGSAKSTKAADTFTDTITGNLVEISCTMTGEVVSPHTANVVGGTLSSDIGETNLKVNCNDPSGFSIFAIGYSGDEEGNTNLISSSGNIATGTATSGSTSNWAMKVTPMGTDISSQNDFNGYHAVPSTYMKVVKKESGASDGTSISAKTTYQVYPSSSQLAGNYIGKVRYTVVHPSTKPCPDGYELKDGTCQEKKLLMQDVAEWGSTLAVGDSIQAVDSRDNTTYTIAKLADNKIWMLDNLALDLTNQTVLNGLDATNTNIDTTNDPDALAALKGTKLGTTSDKYATAKVANWTSSYSYSAPLINSASKDNVYGAPAAGKGFNKTGIYYNYCAASAGSYCYGNGTSAGTSSGNATSSICPKGWRMPTGGSSGEYQALYTAYSSNYTNFRNALSLPLSGDFYNGSAYDQGSNGYFWSSTRYNNGSMYNLYAVTSNIYPANYYGRFNGFSVRCVAGS